jgi:hypothetical protein
MGPDSIGQILSFPKSVGAGDLSGPSSSNDPLDEVDEIFAIRSQGLDQSAESQSQARSERTRLQEEFAAVCGEEIRPAMQAFLERLRQNGGSGLLEERDGIEGAGVAPRIRLWMSLSGEIIGRPRRDQHPYLQLDFDIIKRRVMVAEGDVWRGHGSSGQVGTWNASEITGDMVVRSLVGVLRRAAA